MLTREQKKKLVIESTRNVLHGKKYTMKLICHIGILAK